MVHLIYVIIWKKYKQHLSSINVDVKHEPNVPKVSERKRTIVITLVCFPSPPRCKYLELLHQDKQRATHSYSVRFNYTVCAGKGSFAAPWLSFNAASHLTYLLFLFLGLMRELCCLFGSSYKPFCLPMYHLLLSGGVQATGRVTVSTRSVWSEWYRDVTHVWMGLWKPVCENQFVKTRRFHSTRPPGSSRPFFKTQS